MKKILFILLFMNGFAFAQPAINDPTPYQVCDSLNDGYESFNLTLKNSEILGSLDPVTHVVTFHIDLADAISGIFPLFQPEAYLNSIPYGQTYGVRVTDTVTNEFSTTTLDLVLIPMLLANQAPDMIVNDSPFDGFSSFNLTNQTSTIVGSQTNYEIKYFESLVDATNYTNEIIDPENYQNLSNGQTVYCGLRFLTNGCTSITKFKLLVNNNSIPLNNASPIVVCDDNNDGWSTFDVTTRIPEILGALSPNDYTITFHEFLSDAINDTNAVIDPTMYVNNFSNIAHVRVEENNNSSNFSTAYIDLIVFNTPFIFNTPLPILKVYDNPYDGFGEFNLLSNQASALNGQNNVTVTYHTNQTDALAAANPIVNPSTYNGQDLQTIWMAIQNNTGGCINTTSFQLKVIDTNDIVFIPDNNFKQALLTLNSTFVFGPLGGYDYMDIDTNNDNEIQVGETDPIVAINIMNTDTVDLTGIEEFTNLLSFDCTNNQVTNLNLISGLTGLKSLNCIGSGLTSLDLSTLTNLEYLACYGNQITSLNLTGSPNLVRVDCNNNLLTSLLLGPSSTFNHLDCTNNLLTNLDVSMLTNLEVLLSKNNQLTTIDLSSNTSLQHLSCGSPTTFNSIDVSSLINLKNLEIDKSTQTSLDLTANPLIEEIDISYTNITAIDLSNVTVTGSFIGYNPDLEYLNVKNGGISYVGVNTCPNLTYVCADESEITQFLTNLTNPLYNNNPNVQVNSYCSFVPGGNYNTITGKITYDLGNNGCDLTDDAKPLNKVKINDGVNVGYAFTNDQGIYTFHTLTGNFIITPEIENANFFNLTPSNSVVNFTNTNNNIETRDFCITQNGIYNDLEIVVNPGWFEFNGNRNYQLVYKNKGNQILSGTVNLTFDDSVSSLVDSNPAFSSQVTNELAWNFSNLVPFESRVINLEVSFSSPTDTPPLNPGDILTYSAIVNPVAGDQTPVDNSFTLNETIEDQNDNVNRIVCLQGDSLSPILAGESLHYNVYFENTGSEMVDNVVVKCEIDTTKFDVNSLQLINYSNQIQTRVTNNVVEFIFENVNLALRSGSPPVGGHGNVLFKIDTLEDLSSGDQVGILAKIYFDYNAPIVTNMAETTFLSLSNSIFEFDDSVTIYPNPTNGKVNVKSDFTIKSIELYDIQGRVLITQLGDAKAIDISDKTNGIYFLKITTEKGSKIEKLVKE